MTDLHDALYFGYDASGTPLRITYNGTHYYYVTNLQGDVIAILNSSGTAVVQYTYDAWGNPISTTGSMASTLGAHNPLRYRGYIYDQETHLYYLQSRYYNPKTGRFLNADAFTATGQGILGNNSFAYCNNNPANSVDPEGYGPWTPFKNLFDYYVIHKLVQYDISGNKGFLWQTEVYVKGEKGRGFLDVHDPVTNSYYEVKSKRQASKPATEEQMKKYDVAYIHDGRYFGMINGNPKRGKEQLSGSFKYGAWDVTYQSTSSGLVAYDTEYNSERATKVNTIVISALVAGLSAYLTQDAGYGVFPSPAF